MKRIIAATLTLLLITAYFTKAFAVTCDGEDFGYEWDGATTVLLADGQTNCNVTQGMIRFKIEPEENAVYFALFLTDRAMTRDNMNAGFVLGIEDSDSITITQGDFKENYDTDKYTFNGASSANDDNGLFAEVRVGIKDGVPQTISGYVRFIDYAGEPSDYYRFEIVNPDYVAPTAVFITPTVYKEENTTDKTTVKRTTTKKAKTTRRKTTTTRKSTTKKRTTSEYTFPKYPSPKTTAKKVTSKTTSPSAKPRTTSKEKADITIYYVEKEVIISHVYVTDSVTREVIPANAAPVTTETLPETTSFDQAQLEKISDGQKYKQIVIGASSLAFAGLFGWAVSGLKKKPDIKIESAKNPDNSSE